MSAQGEDDAARIRAMGHRLAELFDAQGREARAALAAAVARHRQVGWPPSFVQLAGVSDLEKPFNRLLGWWARPDEHGANHPFVRRLAKFANLHALVEDLDAGLALEVRVEEGFEADATKQPDLGRPVGAGRRSSSSTISSRKCARCC